jgi:DeoR/GlpR family transcriptional regulator of sugar metabolism
VKQIIAEHAIESILLVDQMKIGHRALSKVLEFSAIQQGVINQGGLKLDLTSLELAMIRINVAGQAKVEHPKDAAHAS